MLCLGVNSRMQFWIILSDNGNYAYSNPGFQPDSERPGQDQGQTVPESPHEDQVSSSLGLPDGKKSSAKSKYDDFGSTTYLNQV